MESVARKMVKYPINSPQNKILDIGCGKGYCYTIFKIFPKAEVHGLDISKYAIANCKPEIQSQLTVGNATCLPWPDKHFDLVFPLLPCTIYMLMIFLMHLPKWNVWGKIISICVWRAIAMNKRKLICFIGK